MSDSGELKTKRWRDLCKRLKWSLPPICWVCGEEIDRSISGRDKMGWTLDHVIPRWEAPQLTYEESNLRPAHNIHNATRGGRQSKVVSSQNWG